MTNGNSAERDLYIQAMFDLIRDKNSNEFDDLARRVAAQSVEGNDMAWRMWQARAALLVCADGGKGEAVAWLYERDIDGPNHIRYVTLRSPEESERESITRAGYVVTPLAAPQAECAPRADDWAASNGYAAVTTAGASDLLPNALWTRRGSGMDEWWSFRGYEAKKDTVGQWVLRKSGEELYRHTDLQVVMAHAERAILAANKEPQP